MRNLIPYFVFAILLTNIGCNSSHSDKTTDQVAVAPDPEYDKDITEMFRVAHYYVGVYADDAIFDTALYAIDTTAIDTIRDESRYKLIQRFSSKDKGYDDFVYKAYLIKYPYGWELEDLEIEKGKGNTVFVWSEAVKENENNNEIKAGGVTFTKIEGSGSIIRLSSKKKLTRRQLRKAIMDLKDTYDNIQFATEARPARGQEYAAWIGGSPDMFFDYDRNDIIENFLK